MNKKYNKDGITVVKLSGTPTEIGLNHGRLCKDEIKEAVNILYKSFEGSPSSLLDSYFEKSWQLEKKVSAEYLEEIKGISVGSGVDYKDILLLNMSTTIDEGQRCFAFTSVNKNHRLLTLRHLDNRVNSDFYRKMILYVIKPNKGYGFVALLMPGIVDSETGMNEKGLTINQNNIRIKQSDWNIKPISALTRKLIQYSDSIDKVEEHLNIESSYPARLIYCSSPESASFFEIANKEKARVDMKNNQLALANHATKLESKTIETESLERLQYANNFLSSNSGDMDHLKMIELGRSSFIARKNYKSKNWQSVLFSPSTLEFWVAQQSDDQLRPACYNKYVGFNLNALLFDLNKKVSPLYFPEVE